MILLRFLASGSFERNAGDAIRVSQPTVSVYLPKVCDALLKYVATFICMPQTRAELQAAALAFHSLAGFPRTIGAIDCTHVKILSPGGLQVIRAHDSYADAEFLIPLQCSYLYRPNRFGIEKDISR